MKTVKQLEYTLSKLNERREVIFSRYPDNTFFLAIINTQINSIEWVLEFDDWTPLNACGACHIAYKGESCPNCGSQNKANWNG